jgi:import receptor subunit TOM22
MIGTLMMVCAYNHAHTIRLTLVTESVISDIDDDDTIDETILDRLSALVDIVPPTTRKNISNAASTGYSWASMGLRLSGKTLWVLSTSALLLGVPWALAFSEEQQVQEMEREMRMQQSANEVSCDTVILDQLEC